MCTGREKECVSCVCTSRKTEWQRDREKTYRKGQSEKNYSLTHTHTYICTFGMCVPTNCDVCYNCTAHQIQCEMYVCVCVCECVYVWGFIFSFSLFLIEIPIWCNVRVCARVHHWLYGSMWKIKRSKKHRHIMPMLASTKSLALLLYNFCFVLFWLADFFWCYVLFLSLTLLIPNLFACVSTYTYTFSISLSTVHTHFRLRSTSHFKYNRSNGNKSHKI